jgi:hypothetical protein
MKDDISENKDMLAIIYLDVSYFTMGYLKYREERTLLDKFGMDWKTKNHETFHGTKFQSNG